MAKFERIQSGIKGFDRMIDNIRLGDNVIIQVSSLDDFRKVATPFVEQAILDKKDVYYIRFALHKPFFFEQDGLQIIHLNPAEGFEKFTSMVHQIITEGGLQAYYVFDCLSDLQVAWSTDLMMGNFFRVTCPYLFELNTVAYFPVLRGHHDFATIARIQETTQVLIDIYADNKFMYLHPIKVWNRYSPDMFLPYRLSKDNKIEEITNSMDLAEYYHVMHEEQLNHEEQNVDSYERFFRQAKKDYVDGKITKWTLNKISRSLMTHDKKLANIIENEFLPEDFFFLKERVIGTGTIGGKACGMLLARKMVENYLPEYKEYMEAQDSFYIATDVYYSYIVDNKLWRLRMIQHQEENYFEKAPSLAEAIMQGQFSEEIRAQFRRMLDYFGQIPIIVRSSSFLEDGLHDAFAGKYESVFCINACDPEERLEKFEQAVKTVYASTLNKSVLEYRMQRGLNKKEEQMAILVQRVSGTKFGEFYMPCVAGVGFSYSIYRWSEETDANAGLLRLVAGLGTKAVDRTPEDYPRLVNLDKPEQAIMVTSEDKHRFSQRRMDVIEYSNNKVSDISVTEMLKVLPNWYVELISEHDYEAERLFRERGENRDILFVSCQEITKKEKLMKIMKNILHLLQEKYENPVDIEYTINFREDGAFTINLLQCRALHIWQEAEKQDIPRINKENEIFRVNQTFMGSCSKLQVDVIVYVSAEEYHKYPYNEKGKITNPISKINQFYKGKNKNILFLTPGRIGTSSPDLGVPVVFADISNFKIICEYAVPEIGFVPELSFGSHMFQDIVETEMFYVALMGTKINGTEELQLALLDRYQSIFLDILPSEKEYENMIRVFDVSEDDNMFLCADQKKRQVAFGNFIGEF